MVNSKNKGSSFEREVCVKLSRWISNGERDDLLWRSSMSGGRATVIRKKGGKNETQGGDISAIDPLGHILTSSYSIECKFYQNLDISSTLLLGKGRLQAFWDQTRDEAEQTSKFPLLIAKQNRIKPIVLTTVYGSRNLGLKEVLRTKKFVLGWFEELMDSSCPL